MKFSITLPTRWDFIWVSLLKALVTFVEDGASFDMNRNTRGWRFDGRYSEAIFTSCLSTSGIETTSFRNCN